jgi:hypothetical protein
MDARGGDGAALSDELDRPWHAGSDQKCSLGANSHPWGDLGTPGLGLTSAPRSQLLAMSSNVVLQRHSKEEQWVSNLYVLTYSSRRV